MEQATALIYALFPSQKRPITTVLRMIVDDAEKAAGALLKAQLLLWLAIK